MEKDQGGKGVRDVVEELKDPGNWYRCAPFWSWNDKLCEEELLRQIDEMHKVGYGGFFMHARVGLVTEYLSKEWMKLVRSCAERAKQLGMLAWLYDEDKWPSGFAGGEVPLKDPRYRHKYLILLKRDEIEPEDEVLKSFEMNGEEFFVVKRTMKLGDVWFNGTCYVDLLSRETTEEFIRSTHERYKEACGDLFGVSIPGIFTDEPTYLRVHHPKKPTLPWTDEFPGEFLKRKGYDVREHLEKLFFNVEGYEKVRFDFFDVATTLFVENFTIPYASWCEKNGLHMTGHFMAEDTLRGQVEWIGAAMPHYEYMQVPGVDKLARNLDQVITIKQVSSVAEQLGKKWVLCETFGTSGQHVSFLHRKWIAEWQAVLGVTYLNPHLSLYSMRGERKRDYPPNLFYQQPWWKDERPFSDYLARLNRLVTLGKRDVKVLVVHPITSAWCVYSKFNDDVDKLDRLLDETVRELVCNKIDFHFGDETILARHGKVAKGRLVVGSYEYELVIIPPLLNLRASTVVLLDEFVKNGGTIIVLGDFRYGKFFPSMVDGERKEMEFLSKALVVNDLEKLIEEVKKRVETVEVIDEKTEKNAKSVMAQKRVLGKGTSVVFIVNTDISREVHCEVDLKQKDANVYALDLYNFSVFPLEGGKLSLTLFPAGSVCFLITRERIPCEVKSSVVISTGALFQGDFQLEKALNKFEVTLCDPNVLILDKVTSYEVEGREIFKNVHVSRIWHDHFYKLPDGTPFRVTYSFEVKEKPKKLFLVVECAENLDRIVVNGESVVYERKKCSFDEEQNFLDVNFAKMEITNLVKEGENLVALEGKKFNNVTAPGCHRRVEDPDNHRPTEVEAIYLVGDFSLSNVDGTRYVMEGPRTPCHHDITRDGYPFYVGSVRLKTSFTLERSQGVSYFLKLNGVSAASVKVYLNGRFCGMLCWEPFLMDVTGFLIDGENELELVMTNTLFNLIEANHKADVMEETFRRPRSFIDFERHTDRYILMPFGLENAVVLSRETQTPPPGMS